MSQYSSPTPDPNVNIVTAVATPTDRVRWGPIIAGLFAALCTLAVLTIVGVAIAGSTYDPGDSARSFGIGAGIWSALSMLIAFFVGGWLAARSAALRSPDTGVLNGAMVWVVAIPLMLYVVMGGIGSLFRTAAPAAGAAMNRPDIGEAAQTASGRIAPTTQRAAEQAQQAASNPENQREAARATAKGAWGTLVSLLLGLAAAAFGGYVGSGGRSDADRPRARRDRAPTPPSP
jgi:hypothetical protein